MDREAAAVAAAEQQAAEIVREAEEEAFRILEQAATVAFNGKRSRSHGGGPSRGRAAALGIKTLALGSFGLAVFAVVEISMGRV